MTWAAARDIEGICMGAHVLPVDDDREHVCNRTCWCKPSLDDEEDGFVWVHHALDGRGEYEGRYGRKLH